MQILDLRILDRAADNAVDRIKIRVAFVIDAVVAEELVGNGVVSVPLAAFGTRHVRPRADGNADDLRTAQNIVHKVGAVINDAEVDVFAVLFKGLEEIVGSIIMLRRDGEGEVPDRFRIDVVNEDMQNIVLLAEFVGFSVDVGKGSHFGGGNAADAADMIIACGFLNDFRAFVCQKFGKQRVRAAAAKHCAGKILVGIKFFEINIVVCDRFFAQIRRTDIFAINHLNGALAFCIVALFRFVLAAHLLPMRFGILFDLFFRCHICIGDRRTLKIDNINLMHGIDAVFGIFLRVRIGYFFECAVLADGHKVRFVKARVFGNSLIIAVLVDHDKFLYFFAAGAFLFHIEQSVGIQERLPIFALLEGVALAGLVERCNGGFVVGVDLLAEIREEEIDVADDLFAVPFDFGMVAVAFVGCTRRRNAFVVLKQVAVHEPIIDVHEPVVCTPSCLVFNCIGCVVVSVCLLRPVCAEPDNIGGVHGRTARIGRVEVDIEVEQHVVYGQFNAVGKFNALLDKKIVAGVRGVVGAADFRLIRVQIGNIEVFGYASLIVAVYIIILLRREHSQLRKTGYLAVVRSGRKEGAENAVCTVDTEDDGNSFLLLGRNIYSVAVAGIFSIVSGIVVATRQNAEAHPCRKKDRYEFLCVHYFTSLIYL